MPPKRENLQPEQEDEFCSKCQEPKGQVLFERYSELRNKGEEWAKLKEDEQKVWISLACKPRRSKPKKGQL